MNTIQQLYRPIESLLFSTSSPFTVLTGDEIIQESKGEQSSNVAKLPRIFLDQFDLRNLLANSAWIDQDIKELAASLNNINTFTTDDMRLGHAFYQKYGHLTHRDDARSVAINWSSDLKRALSHVNQKALKGRILHIGCDKHYEAPVLHSNASSVVLVDIAEKLLQRAISVTKCEKSIVTRAEKLYGIGDASIDLYVALRVFCSTGFDAEAAIKQASRVLKKGGSILISVSNGYKAIDNTILPGQVIGIPPVLDFSRPFKETLVILNLLFNTGFRELFLVPGETELFLGGTLFQSLQIQNQEPILHTDGLDYIPLCFYSERMPTVWLGSFSPHSIIIDGIAWPTIEHFFQANKFSQPFLRKSIELCESPIKAKQFAWSYDSEKRKDWTSVRIPIMQRGLKAKFDQYPNLKKTLLATKNRDLIERSEDDLFWGFSLEGEGANRMGNLLKYLRKNYKSGG